MKVEAFTVAGASCSLNVAVTEPDVPNPEPPADGFVVVMVGGVVSATSEIALWT